MDLLTVIKKETLIPGGQLAIYTGQRPDSEAGGPPASNEATSGRHLAAQPWRGVPPAGQQAGMEGRRWITGIRRPPCAGPLLSGLSIFAPFHAIAPPAAMAPVGISFLPGWAAKPPGLGGSQLGNSHPTGCRRRRNPGFEPSSFVESLDW